LRRGAATHPGWLKANATETFRRAETNAATRAITSTSKTGRRQGVTRPLLAEGQHHNPSLGQRPRNVNHEGTKVTKVPCRREAARPGWPKANTTTLAWGNAPGPSHRHALVGRRPTPQPQPGATPQDRIANNTTLAVGQRDTGHPACGYDLGHDDEHESERRRGTITSTSTSTNGKTPGAINLPGWPKANTTTLAWGNAPGRPRHHDRVG
jgi:hypothetical protein